MIFSFALAATVQWIEPDWSANASIPSGDNRQNIYQLNSEELRQSTHDGRLHGLNYPVQSTGILVPYNTVKKSFTKSSNPIREFLRQLAKYTMHWDSIDDFYAWLGLSPYPNENSESFPYKDNFKPNDYMGATAMETSQGKGLTFSCSACHSGMLFGQPILGLPAKRPRSNDLFLKAKNILPKMTPLMFQLLSGASAKEKEMYSKTRENLRSVGVIQPQVLGLDTSLAQVALSLAHRNDDDYATKNSEYEKHPRANPLEHFVADSKPGTWWVVKYKTRWLSDGSIISGNPIYTNFLWNEIGRGADLQELESWMQNNSNVIHELTAAVFNTPSPHWTDFFDPSSINIDKAKRGETLFNNTCSKCHGTYQKGWSTDTTDPVQMLKNYKVFYHDKTPVINVGTDSQRAQGMSYFADQLNQLAISKTMGTVVVPQKGYIPPPLEGIFARFPYFHNASVPNLCAVLSPVSDRPVVFAQGEPLVPGRDFDIDCIGYPTGEKTPKSWWDDSGAVYDTRKPGLSNQGHEFQFSSDERSELIEFLKTL